MTRFVRTALVLSLCISFITLSSCRRARLPNLPVRANLTFTTSADLNSGSDTEARPRATRVKVYQLRDRSTFTVIDRGTFWANEREALGGQLVKEECGMTLYPEQEEDCAFTLEDGTRFLGIAADLFEPVEDQWRAVIPLDDIQARQIVVSVDANRLETKLELYRPDRDD